jgi:phenylalanine-4-hydroxylase
MHKLVLNSKQEFLDAIKKASIVIVYADTTLPIFSQFTCSIGELNMRILSYGKYEVIEILPHVADVFKLFWSKVPTIKYYFIQKLNENDNYGAVIPAKSNDLIEKLLEDEVK